MARKPSTASRTPARKRVARTRTSIPEPFQIISSATIEHRAAKLKVPMLVLYGDWLKAVGFPIGSTAYVTTDQRGELALRRFGIRFPGRFRVRVMPS